MFPKAWQSLSMNSSSKQRRDSKEKCDHPMPATSTLTLKRPSIALATKEPSWTRHSITQLSQVRYHAIPVDRRNRNSEWPIPSHVLKLLIEQVKYASILDEKENDVCMQMRASA